MNDIRKLLDIINETTAGATASGGVAPVSQSMHTQRRVEEDYTEESSDKPQMPQILEYGNWENSALTTSKKLKKSRKKASKIVKSVYGEDMSGEKKEVTEGSQLARTARKIIPGLGRMQAKMRADHEREQGRLAMSELPGRERKETEPDDEYWSTRAMGNRHYDRAKKFDKIASGVDENVTETKVGNYKDLGATSDTTHFIKNVTTGKIVSPHRSRQDAEDALIANKQNSNDEFKIVRARKEGVAEGSENIRYEPHPDMPKKYVIVTQVPPGVKGIKVGDKISRDEIKLWAGFSPERKKKSVAEGVSAQDKNISVGDYVQTAAGVEGVVKHISPDGKKLTIWNRKRQADHRVDITKAEKIPGIARRKMAVQDVTEGYEKKDMTGKTCKKCKKDTYQERSLRDDWEGTLRCSCGHVVDRWRKYKKKDDEQGVAEGSENQYSVKHDHPTNKNKYAFSTISAPDIKTAKKLANEKFDGVVSVQRLIKQQFAMEGVAEGQTGKPIKPGRTFRFPNHWNKADVVFEFLRKKNAVVDVEYSYDTKKWTVTDSRPATEKDIKQWSTINGGLPSVNEQGVAEDIASTRREVNLKKKIDKDVATPEQKKEYQELKAKNMGGHALKQSVAVSKDSKKK